MKKSQLTVIIKASTCETLGTDQAWRNLKQTSGRRQCIRQGYLEFQYLVAQCPNSLFLDANLQYPYYPTDSTENFWEFLHRVFHRRIKVIHGNPIAKKAHLNQCFILKWCLALQSKLISRRPAVFSPSCTNTSQEKSLCALIQKQSVITMFWTPAD